MAKPKLLYLCHRIPYPPNKGDKIRSFNLLKSLADHYDVYLGCFIDDEYDLQYVDKLADWCIEYKFRFLRKTVAKLRGLSAFITGKPITLPFYHSVELQHWVHQAIAKHQIETVFVFSSSMAQYVDHPQYKHLHKVIDFVDVDSDKWRQYAENQRGLMSWIYHREYKQLQRLEQHYCEHFNYSLFVSDDEARLFQNLMPQALQSKIKALANGVDLTFFDPNLTSDYQSIEMQQPSLVFTGAMDYWANADAVIWFVQHVWPVMMATRPDLHFYIVGGNPTREVVALTAHANVHVTGRVHDVRPYIATANLIVAPLRIARGIQNKVLEAMAMAKPIVATAMAMEGINPPALPALKVSDESTVFATACLELINASNMSSENRQWVLEHFTWQAKLASLPAFLSNDRA